MAMGRIAMRGDRAEIEARYGSDLILKDLRGKTLMPGFFDSHSHAVLSAAKLEDLIVLSDNPLEIDPLWLRDIQVLQTIKKGQVAYTRPAP